MSCQSERDAAGTRRLLRVEGCSDIDVFVVCYLLTSVLWFLSPAIDDCLVFISATHCSVISVPSTIHVVLLDRRLTALTCLGWFSSRGQDTLLGETADPTEVFVTDECEDMALDSVTRQVILIHMASGALSYYEGS